MTAALYTPQGRIASPPANTLLTDYAPLVRRLALQLIAKLPSSVELDDLIQVGMMGLLQAGERFEDLQRAKFETYASQRIRGAMLDELRANDWASRGLRQSSRQVAQAVQAQEHKLGRAPNESEIAAQLDLPLAAYQQLLQDMHGCQLVYHDAYEDEDHHFLDQHASRSEDDGSEPQNPLDQLLRRGLRQRLLQALEAMPEREQLLLSLYYEQELNLREIGAVLDVSQSRVCQLHSQAISRLRALLADVLEG